MADSLLDASFENVFIYIGDAVRWDFTPDKLLNAGLAVKGLASSIHSPTSIASLISGKYPPQHNVVDFTTQLNPEIPTVYDFPINTSFINTINNVRFDPTESEDIIANTLGIEVDPPKKLKSIESPFLIIERGPGGHAPYVREDGINDGTQYFETRGAADRSTYATEYRQAVDEDIKWFFSRVELLRQRGILEKTLIIYLSDHGELLGENGMLAHAPPIHPKHVYVPCVFIHPELSRRFIRERLVRHVDIAPTIQYGLDIPEDVMGETVGRDLTTLPAARRGASFFTTKTTSKIGTVTAEFESAWDSTGGYVWPTSSRGVQMLLASHQLFRVPWRSYARSNIFAHIPFLLKRERVHGSPLMSKTEAREIIKYIKSITGVGSDTKSIDVPVNRLKELGYME